MSESSSAEEDTTFYFESDHLALRGHPDYTKMLRTIAILEVQRTRVLKQIEDLEIAKQRYMQNPELLIEKLRNNEEIIAPNYMTIEKIPEISTNLDFMPENDAKVKEEPESDSKPATVRGRIVDESKSETFNQLWSCEEQRRLEELLIEYPAEAIESRRYAKIAKALGNRTPQQVSSRVQKYFKKLHDAGLPIPGRRPKNRRGGQSKAKHFFRPTTFFPAFNVPVHMPEDDYSFGDLRSESSPAPTDKRNTSTETPPEEGASAIESLSAEDRERMMKILNLIKEEKMNTPEGYNPDPLARLCETCRVAAVSRLHWRCNTCYIYLNQCSDCIVSQLLSQNFEHLPHDVVRETDS
ncbi:ZZ-type zinc finger-containing protein 3-like [Rhagoletis pomonella]|uniref:ZZ-type zinc finger-containing protein 3-like n=1 Tax=Rhagoletis pomonella TaxID=28610 RepID=UPI00178654EA|nr:ZZ-type zinc finger-containing protein 3-like [Rhagoletis pomonella]